MLCCRALDKNVHFALVRKVPKIIWSSLPRGEIFGHRLHILLDSRAIKAQFPYINLSLATIRVLAPPETLVESSNIGTPTSEYVFEVYSPQFQSTYIHIITKSKPGWRRLK
jgi:hypothetical protein